MANKQQQYNLTAKCYDKAGNLLSTGVNSYAKTHPLQARWARLVDQPERIYLHAEISAIIRARSKDIHKIKVERYNSKGEPANAHPCPVCMLAIKQAGIKYIEYTLPKSV